MIISLPNSEVNIVDLCVSENTHFSLLDNIRKLSCPDEAVVVSDQEEAVATVQGGRSGLNKPGLDMPPT